MQVAVEFVLAKSKTLRDKIEEEQLSDVFVMQAISRNATFIIAYNSYLQKLINNK